MLVRIFATWMLLCAVFAGDALAHDARPGTLRFALENGALAVEAPKPATVNVRNAHTRTRPASELLIGFENGSVSDALAAQLGLVDSRGFVITRVTTPTAREAGLQRFDVIRFVDGVVATQKALDDAKARAQLGGEVVLGVYRRGNLIEVPVQIVLRH